MGTSNIFFHEDSYYLNFAYFSSFPQSFQYISNYRSHITFSDLKCGCSIYFFLQFCRSDFWWCGYFKNIQESALDFEITSGLFKINISIFQVKKVPYLELCLFQAIFYQMSSLLLTSNLK